MLKRSSIFASGALHIAVIAAASLAWPTAVVISDEFTHVIPVELATVADETNIAPKVEEQPKAETPPEPPPPEQVAVTPPPPEPEIEVAPPEPEKKPEPPKEVAEKTPPPPPAPPLPRQRPKPEPPQPQFSVDSVLALLDKRTPPKAAAPAAAPVSDTTVKGLGAQNSFTVDLRDALLSQMRECWNVPVGAPDPEKLIVQVRVFLAQDGSLAQPPLLEPQTRVAAASNPYMRTAAEAALRAVSVCEPYRRLPVDRYDQWREIVMTFDPSRMVGR